MNRMKKHRIKEEKASTSHTLDDHDLAYFIHDRVELMHQVFSVLKSKELKSLAPECVRRLSIDDLQELCLEELLGISSKRLCAILDGAEPPSDTDSSSQSAEQMETISLDSISSDEEILSQSSKKKKHKHRHSKKKRRKKSKGSDEEQGETRASRAGLTVLELLELQARARAIRAQLHQEPASEYIGNNSKGADEEQGESRASRAGLTVLELLELQARARAIRAQLHQEPAKVQEPVGEERSSDNDEVLIKEEPAEVVEISSDEEKPDVARLQKQIEASTSQTNVAETNKNGDSQSVTKRINDLIITVPQSKPTRKIKLKRQKPTETVTREKTPEKVVKVQVVETNNTANSTVTSSTNKTSKKETVKASPVDDKNKNKKSKKKKQKAKEKRGSDEDEITIQLSDTEKMDLLEDLDAKTLDMVTSSGSDSSDESEDNVGRKVVNVKKVANSESKTLDNSHNKGDNVQNNKVINSKNNSESTEMKTVVTENFEIKEQVEKDDEIRGYVSKDNDGTIEINDLPVITDEITTSNKDESSDPKADDVQIDAKADVSDAPVEVTDEENTDKSASNVEENSGKQESISCQGTKSDGEISDRESSEIEASDVPPAVVCVSDDDGKKKKKKKKEKKKTKKEKTKSVFREEQDENFYKEKEVEGNSSIVTETIDDDDDVYEYLEISDDSSCYEVEGVSVLSKEPTAEEIEAFSARMDEIDIDRVETIVISEDSPAEQNEASDIENISWKDRYLGSKKVKRVLTTSNILNAIRKKNRELKKKLEEAKKAEKEKEVEVEKANSPTLEDGTIEQYETLQGSTTYVDPVKEPEVDISKEGAENIRKEVEENTSKEEESTEGENVTREMKKDAKMLLKMYKRLLKYNDITKQKDPNKKKKKKHKKSKDKDKVASIT